MNLSIRSAGAASFYWVYNAVACDRLRRSVTVRTADYVCRTRSLPYRPRQPSSASVRVCSALRRKNTAQSAGRSPSRSSPRRRRSGLSSWSPQYRVLVTGDVWSNGTFPGIRRVMISRYSGSCCLSYKPARVFIVPVNPECLVTSSIRRPAYQIFRPS